jgi:hypothetical protein
VTVGTDARLRELDRNLVRILESLERSGEFLETATPDRDLAVHANPSVCVLATKGVVRLMSAKPWPGEIGKVQIGAVGTGGPAQLDWSGFDLWLTDLLTSGRLSDVRNKLAATGSPERHAFIGVRFTTPWSAYHALTRHYRDLPRSIRSFRRRSRTSG